MDNVAIAWRCGSLGAAASGDSARVPSRVRCTAPRSAVVLVKVRFATPHSDIDLRLRTYFLLILQVQQRQSLVIAILRVFLWPMFILRHGLGRIRHTDISFSQKNVSNTSTVSSTDRVVDTQPCKLHDTSGSII